MIIAGAKGHALEVLGVLDSQEYRKRSLAFYDDVSDDLPQKIFNKFPIIRNFAELKLFFKEDSDFVLGVGLPRIRRILSDKMREQGGTLKSAISSTAIIGHHDIQLGLGLNIMHRCFISEQVTIGEGALINAGAHVHHDVVIGDYVELAPMAVLLGGTSVGSDTFIGAGSTILPKIEIGSNCIIGAGSVVTKNLPDNTRAFGVPAKVIGAI